MLAAHMGILPAKGLIHLFRYVASQIMIVTTNETINDIFFKETQ